jgi:hypothetical protein
LAQFLHAGICVGGQTDNRLSTIAGD